MRLLAKKSIHTKLRLLTCAVGVSAVALACLGFAGLTFYQACSTEAQQLKTHAQLIGHYSTPVITLRNAAAGERLLSSLKANSSIESASLFDVQENCIAQYGKSKPMTFPFHLKGKPYRVASLKRLEILSQVETAGQHIGYIYLRANTDAAHAKLVEMARATGVVFLVALGFAGLVAIPFKRAISKPIQELVNSVEDVGANGGAAIKLASQSPECIDIISGIDRLRTKINETSLLAERATNELEERVSESNHGLAQELKRLQKRQHELERAKTAAEAANQAKSAFVADMSREMRKPLDRIVNGVVALRSIAPAFEQPTAASQLDAIGRDGRQLQQLVQDVAENAEVEAGRVTISCIEFAPEGTIAATVAEFQGAADAKGLAYEYRWRGNENESMYCDPSRLRQVVQVLIDNAIQFTEVGGVRVSARFEHGQDGRQLCLEVTDTGAGIAADDLDQIFEHSELRMRGADRDGEAVMGLHNCRSIVSALGGEISISSSVGEGSVFTVLIDAEVKQTSATDRQTKVGGETSNSVQITPTCEATGVTTSPDTEQTNVPRILVVDDSDTNRDVTQLILRRAGAHVDGAENGLEAVQAALLQPYDLIFMDMQMPIMDGFSATREIRSQGLTLPIVALTAYAMDFDEQKCRSAGCNGHLTKPIAPEDLLTAASRALPTGKVLSRKGPVATKPVAQPAPEPVPVPAARPRSPYDI